MPNSATSTDPFAGLEEVKAPSSAAPDAFAGLEEVKAPEADAFSGLKPADNLDLQDESSLAGDDAFRPAQFIAENPGVVNEPDRFKKLINVYRQKRVTGLSAGKVAAAAVHEAPGVIAKTVKGAGQLIKRAVDIGVQPAANEVLGLVTGTNMAPLREETRKGQLKAAGEIAAGTEQAVTGLAQLGGQAARKLFGTAPDKLTDSELYDQLLVDSEFHKQTNQIAQGNSDLSKSIGLDSEFLSKNGVQLDPKAIENLSLVDPLTLVATAGVFKVVGVGGKVIATAATKLGGEAVINGLKTIAGKSLQAAGQVAAATGKVIQKAPLRTPSVAAIGGSLATGNVPHAIAASVVPAAVRLGGRALEAGGRVAAEVGQAAVPGFIGPPTAAAARLAQIAASPAAQVVKGVAKGGAAGAALAAPLALAADENQTAGAILGGGAALGAVAGAAHVGGKIAGNAVANVVAKKFFDPHSIPFEPVQSPGYGVDKALDATHDAAMQTLSAPEQNAINNFREALRAQGGEIYVQDPQAYADRIRQSLQAENGGGPLTPEQEAKATAYADTHAEFDGFITDSNGQPRRVVFLNGGAKGLPHDAGHLFQSLLDPQKQTQLRDSVFQSYTPEQLNEFGKAYTDRLGDPEYFNKLGEEAGRNKIADEIIAENFSQLFGNTPLSELKGPKSFLETLGRTAAEAGESLGLDLTGGRTTPDLQATPSIRLQNVLRNASREVLNAPATKEKLTLTKATAPEKVPTAAEIPAVSAKPDAIQPPVSAKPDVAAERAKVTGIAEARELTKDNPEASATVDTISKSMEAGNPALKIEHRGITSQAPVGPRGEARGPRRGTQEAGYAELERLQIENRANAPESVVSVHEKTFVPVRWVNQGGKATLIAMSMDKILGNIRKITEEAAAKKADKLIPYESVGGELTEKGWNEALADVKTYAENQSNGYRGDGARLVRPSDEAGVSIPAENPNYTPKTLGEAQANFANLVQGIAPPQTARMVKGQVPGNVKAQLVAEVNQRVPQPVAKISPKDITKQTFGKPFEGRTVKETNPLRNELSSKGVNVRALTEATERFAAQDIASVGEAAPEAQMKAPVTDVIRGGFLPAGKTVEQFGKEIISQSGDDWLKTAQSFKGGLTPEAYRLGLGLTDVADVKRLTDLRDEALAKYREEITAGRAEEAYPWTTKAQFFSEALGAATDTGSAANPRVGWRRVMPDAKAPFPQGKAEPRLEQLRPERLFLPAADIEKSLDPIKRAAIRTRSGKIYEGSWHGEAYTEFADAIARGEANEKLPPGFSSLTDLLDSVMSGDLAAEGVKDFVEDGFVTEKGKFLNRAQALDHAEKIGQLKAGAPAEKNSARGEGVLESAEFENERSFLPKGDKPIRDLASEYAKTAKIPYTPHETYTPLNPKLGEKLADFYDSAKSDPTDPAVQKSYRALADETLAQYKAMTDAGYTIEPFKGEGEPYKNSDEAIADIRDNKHLYFLQTEKTYGAEGEAKTSANPMLADSGIKIDGQKLLVNDVFRAVHDFFGHGKEGYQFGPRGEFNAWRAHSEMFSPEAQGALAAETLAQNSWVNFGKQVRGKELALKDRPFAEQKAIIVPDELIQEAKNRNAGEMKFLPSKEPRAIKDAAVQDPETGKIYTGRYHLAAFDEASKAGLPEKTLERLVDGFVTNEGEFLNREDSFSRAVELKQITPDDYREQIQAYKDEGVPVADVPSSLENTLFNDVRSDQRKAFLPRKKAGGKVNPEDLTKRDEQGRPLTRGGLVDYTKLYAEKSKKAKEQEAADLASIPKKYSVSEKMEPPKGSLTGWVLPNDEFVPLDTAYHEDFLAKNSEQLNKEFGTNLSSKANPEERLGALQKGFVRVRYTPNDGTVRIEAAANNWTPKVQKSILDKLEEHENSIARVYAAVMDSKGNVVDSVSERVAELDGPERIAAMKDALSQLKGATTERPKGVGPTDIQRARAMGQTREPQFLPKPGTKEFNDYVDARIKDSKKFPEALPLEFRKDESGDYRTGFNGDVLPVSKDYDLAGTPLAKKSKGKTPEQTEDNFTSALAKGLEKEYTEAKKNPSIKAGETWYSVCREKLQALLGEDTKMFAELLGATSPQTNVDANFAFALDAYNQFKRGAYDKMLEKYREGKTKFKTGDLDEFISETGKKGAKATYDAFMYWWAEKNNLVPTQSNGKRFGMNSRAVLRVLDGSWLENVKGPKTPNFTGNLTGSSFEATIDVWAMRTLHRLANEGNPKRWRIQSGNETGVTDSDFFTGQKAFRKAAEKLGLQPDALQAILWFNEKDLWEKNGWTSSVGKKKSDYNVLLQATEKTPEGLLKKVDKQLSFDDRSFLPMKKKDYKTAVEKAGFEFRDWLDILPNGHVLSNPVPLVQVPRDAKPPPGFTFQWSTIFYVEGHDHPKGTKIVAMVAAPAEKSVDKSVSPGDIEGKK